MLSVLLTLHSLFRWILVTGLIFTIIYSFVGLVKRKKFTKISHLIRHCTATIAHIQLLVGLVLYISSPLVKAFWSEFRSGGLPFEITFYGLIHFILMVTAVTIISIGSMLTEKQESDVQKYKTITIYYLIAFVLIFIAIPWPFSPFAERPFFR